METSNEICCKCYLVKSCLAYNQSSRNVTENNCFENKHHLFKIS